MRRQDNSAHIQPFLSRITESIFSSTRNSKARAISNKLSRFSALSVSIALSMLLAALVLSPSAPRMLSRGCLVTVFAQAPESITTYAADCASAQPANTWNLGGTACAKAANSPGDRRIAWVAPDGSVARVTDFFSGALTDSYTILTGADPLAQVGTWTVETIDPSSGVFATAQFIVLDPANASADLSVADFGPFQTSAGSNVSYRVELTNKGPDAAQTVALTSSVPGNTTFVSETQDSGPTFTCTTPSAGANSGTINCTIATLPANATAVFTLVFNVNSGTPNGTVITDTASVSSTTNDPHLADNSASTSTTVVSATSGCTVTCPSVSPVPTAQCNAVVTYGTPTISGDCGGSVVVCSPPSGSTFPIGNTTITCTAQSGDSCSFTVTVNYTGTTSGPTISCPSNITVSGVSGGTATVNYPAPTTTGNCVTVVCSPPSGSVFSTGNTTVNCTATNPANNTASCSFTVTVTSTTCALDCPDDKTVNESSAGSGSATVTYSTATAVGPCPSLTITCNPPSGSSFPVGLTTVICSGKDTSDVVVATCSFTVRVNSLPACAITCPANVTVNEDTNGTVDPNTGGRTVVTYAPTTSNCANGTVVCNPASGTKFAVGTTVVTCTAADAAGSPSSCSFTVTVIGGTPCVITCPSNITQSSDSGGCTKVVSYPSPTTSGSCGGDPNANPPIPTPPPACNPPSGSIFPVGITSVTCSTDVGTECSFTVTITGDDAVAPVITTCATPTFALADSTCQAPVPNVTTDVEASDNCTPAGLLTVTQNPAAGTLVGTGTTLITVTVKDANNNSSTCTTTFTLFETTPPTALCKPYTAVLDANGNASITAANVDNGSTDNCAIASRTVTPSTFTCANKGANTVTLTVTDPSGNSATCQATVTVVDNTPPTISCHANVVQSTDPNLCTAVVTYSNATATDNCPNVGTPACSPASGSTFPKGTTTVNCTVSDASSNSASCSFTVTVNDTQLPVISCHANVVQSTDPNLCTAVVTYSNATATDNCPNVGTPACSPASGSTFSKGTTTVNCTVSDASSNSASCSFTVTVNDTQLPAISCPANITVEPTCPAGAKVTYTAPVGTDNCTGSVTTQTAGLGSLSIFPIGVTTTNTFKVTDTSGNFVTCSFTVRVKTAAEVIQDLINRVQALQPPLTGQQSQGLIAKLQAALDAVNESKTNVACNKLADFINQVQVYIGNGTLTSAQGQPLINSANNVRNALGCTNLPCS